MADPSFEDERELALLEQAIAEQLNNENIQFQQQQQLIQQQANAQQSVPSFAPGGISISGQQQQQQQDIVLNDVSNQGQQGQAVTEVGYQSTVVRVPPHRMAPLRDSWIDLYTPLVEQLGLQVRMNTRIKAVEMRECETTLDSTSLQKAIKFLEAFFLGFDVGDALAVLRLDDLYVESFNVDDVKQMIHGDHLSRAIGRIAGKDGKTKFAIENATRTRIVLADKRIHILGSFQNIKIARNAVCDLILGSPPGKVYSHLRAVSSRLKEQF